MSCLIASVPLFSAASASAQTYWVRRPEGEELFGRRDGPGPQYGSGGDRYGYGAGYSYAKQAPSEYQPWR